MTIIPLFSAVIESVLVDELVEPELTLPKREEGSTPVSPNSPEPVYPDSETRLSGTPSESKSVMSSKIVNVLETVFVK